MLVLLVRLVRRVVQKGFRVGVVSGSCFNLFLVAFKLGGCSMLNTRPVLNVQ